MSHLVIGFLSHSYVWDGSPSTDEIISLVFPCFYNRNERSASLHWPRLCKTFAAFFLDSVGVYSRRPLNDERDSFGHLDFHLLDSLPKTALFDVMNKYQACIISIFTLHNSYITFRVTLSAHVKKNSNFSQLIISVYAFFRELYRFCYTKCSAKTLGKLSLLISLIQCYVLCNCLRWNANRR